MYSFSNGETQIQTIKDGLARQLYDSGYDLKEEGLIGRKGGLIALSTSQINSHLIGSNIISSKESNENISEIPIKSKYADQIQSEFKSEPRPSSARDSDSPRPLTLEEQKEFSLSISVFGKHCVSCLLSSIFNHREEGMKIAETFLKSTPQECDHDEVVKATFQILSLVAADARERSHAQMIALFFSFIGIALIN